MKKCPYCAEEIQDVAIRCRHCGSKVGRQPVSVVNVILGLIVAFWLIWVVIF